MRTKQAARSEKKAEGRKPRQKLALGAQRQEDVALQKKKRRSRPGMAAKREGRRLVKNLRCEVTQAVIKRKISQSTPLRITQRGKEVAPVVCASFETLVSTLLRDCKEVMVLKKTKTLTPELLLHAWTQWVRKQPHFFAPPDGASWPGFPRAPGEASLDYARRLNEGRQHPVAVQ